MSSTTLTTMSYETPKIYKMQPPRNRRDERAKRARFTYNRDIPNIMRTCPRAKHGIQSADLIVDPPAAPSPPLDSWAPLHRTDLKIRVMNSDTLAAAARISSKPFVTKRTTPSCKNKPEKPNVCILNMASASRPGGGFLDGANSQEEFLCARTTLYPSLWDSYYRLPEVSGIYSPDILAFRNSEVEADDLAKRDRYFVDVISSSMLRFSEAKAEGCSCGVSYCDRHRDLVVRKMKAVMRIAQAKGAQKLVLGAWGCGSNGNPIKEIAKAWRKVVIGAQRQRKPNVERWEGINEIIFAIPDRSMMHEFELAFKDVLSYDPITPAEEEERMDSGAEMQDEDLSKPRSEDKISELISRIAETEVQIETNISVRQRQLHRETLGQLKRELALGLAAKGTKDEDVDSSEEDEQEYSFVGGPGPAGSDEEVEGGFFNLSNYSSALDDDDDVRNVAYDSPSSVLYEFRPTSNQTSLTHDGFDSSHDEDELSDSYAIYGRSPRFDPDSGWFQGSVDQLSRELKLGRIQGSGTGSPGTGSPPLKPTSGGTEISEDVLGAYLRRYEGR